MKKIGFQTKKKTDIPDFILHDIVDEDACWETSRYPHIKYPFSHFNRVQSTILEKVGYDTDVNIVLGTRTSSGKTICAELLMGDTLTKGKKVVYISPLKSLTQEKFDDWSELFEDYKICILTGDYVLSPTKAGELKDADIICLTSEMIDSRSRKADMEKSSWLFDVGLILVDEAHIIATSRGHAVEVGLMRTAKLVPNARIMLLSATMTNIEDFLIWLTRLNGKRTVGINSNWRPTELTWEYVEYKNTALWKYKDMVQEQISLVIALLKMKPDEKFLVFVHAKTVGHQLLKAIKAAGITVQFHNADLAQDERMKIERSFENRKGGLRVLLSTSTLAWGRNLPARNVVIVGIKRGISDVDILDFIQMGGRAGRLNIDPCGTVFLICPDEQLWKQKIARSRPIISTLLNKDILGFHVLAEMRIHTIDNDGSLFDWFKQSLAYIQGQWDECIALQAVEDLNRMLMLHIKNEEYKITPLGVISAIMYYLPKDVYHLDNTFGTIVQADAWGDDCSLAYAIGGLPTHQLSYIPKDLATQTNNFSSDLRSTGVFVYAPDSAVAAALYHFWEFGKSHIIFSQIQRDIDRISETIRQISKVRQWGNNIERELRILGVRVKYGVRRELAHLCLLPGIGKVRAEKLDLMGIRKYSNFTDDKRGMISGIIGVKTAEKVFNFLNKKRAAKIRTQQQ